MKNQNGSIQEFGEASLRFQSIAAFLKFSIVLIAIAMFFKKVLTWLCKVKFLSIFVPRYLQSFTFVTNVFSMLKFLVLQALLSFFIQKVTKSVFSVIRPKWWKLKNCSREITLFCKLHRVLAEFMTLKNKRQSPAYWTILVWQVSAFELSST